ncbi:MAG: extracellular solute-binding protein [Acidimicrobiia bacterium]|nr:extracellular solute-binding protein [Acidimicrobiia bacterium]NNF09906.1 extracellular solute-binding protein [Acidimicrobiia bacterium]NNL70533.1 extracellular solute-binding protein [Acidimicrobiia bacterium]
MGSHQGDRRDLHRQQELTGRPAGMIRYGAALALAAVVAAACSGSGDSTVTLYTSVTQATVDAVVAGYEADNPGTDVAVFRAPTGEVAARLEADRRSGAATADVVWLSDPLSMYQYRADGILLAWDPQQAAALPEDLVSGSFWGTRILHLVLVVPAGNPAAVEAWQDLTRPDLAAAIPDPRFAGSAFAALGYFGLEPGFGMDFFAAVRAAGAVQVNSPGDVVTGVAEGRYDAGLTLEFSARTAADKGSPIEVVWPAPAAIAVTSPIAVLAAAEPADAARDFVEHVLSPAGQAAIGESGWTPVRDDAPGPRPPAGASVAYPDWSRIWQEQSGLLDAYAGIFDE